jgi:hypothetical protein
LQLRDAFNPNPAKRGFWQQLMQQQLGPISDDEAPGAGLTRAGAEQYVQLHGAQQAAPGGIQGPQKGVSLSVIGRSVVAFKVVQATQSLAGLRVCPSQQPTYIAIAHHAAADTQMLVLPPHCLLQG